MKYKLIEKKNPQAPQTPGVDLKNALKDITYEEAK
jgi:hypothetical protein